MTRFTSFVVPGVRSVTSIRARFYKGARWLALAAVLAVSVISGQAQADADNTFRISAIPDEAPTELIRKFEPLAEYLSNALDMPVSFVPVTNYAAAVQALLSEQIDMAWLGGFTYIQAAQGSDGTVEPII